MNIVVLDSDPAFGSHAKKESAPIGALSCPALSDLGNLVSFKNTLPEQIAQRAKEAQVILTNKVPLGSAEFSQLPKLQLVSVLATGVNVVDLEAARAHGITVCNVPGYSTASTAQHAIALMLELFNRVGQHSTHVRSGHWQTSPAFSYFLAPLHEVEGKTLGIVGLGAIGTRVGKIAEALGMRVIAHTRTRREDAPFPLVSLDALLRESDVVSLHCPLTPQTHHLVNADSIAKMKQGAIVINVARGPIVDERALAEALGSGHIAAVGTDVLGQEPPRSGSALLSAPNCLVTPHIAWATVEARERLLSITAANIRAFFDGKPQNVVS